MEYFSVGELLAEAGTLTGLSNFGSDNFREGLEHLVSGVNEAGLVIPGREDNLKNDLVRLLVNRLRWQKDLADHPEIADEALLPPVTIVSLPRVGTTKLQRMLSSTSAFQDLPYWQILMPGRIHGLPDNGVEQRLSETDAFCNWRVSVQPDIQKTHRITALDPEEDIFLQELGFRSNGLGFIHQSEQYLSWVAQQDISLSYDILKALLQYLQWQFHGNNPKPWLLKSPVNLGMENQLERIFPAGMKLICPHREPAEIFPSLCRLIETYSGIYYQSRPRKALGEMMLEGQAQGMDRHMQWRIHNSSVEILDMSFREICDDSVATAEKIHDFIGLPLTDSHRDEIACWDRKNPRHKDGKITETLANYGLTAEGINERFSRYRDSFSGYL